MHKVEVLGDGQMTLLTASILILPTISLAWWRAGPKLRREDLPLITAESAAAFIARAAEVAQPWLGKSEPKIKWCRRCGRQYRRQESPTANAPGAQAALEGCAEELAGTPAGDRNNVLCRNVFALARWWAPADCARGGRGNAVRCGRVLN